MDCHTKEKVLQIEGTEDKKILHREWSSVSYQFNRKENQSDFSAVKIPYRMHNAVYTNKYDK